MIVQHPQSVNVIDTDIDSAWLLLSDFSSYKSWNPGLSFASVPVIGNKTKMQLRLAGFDLTVKVVFEVIDAEQKRVQWIGGPKGLITGQHYFQLEPIDEHSCRLIQGEKFRGVLVKPLWRFLNASLLQLYRNFDQAFVQYFK